MTPKKEERMKAIPITEKQMRIMTLYNAGVPQADIARVVGVTKQAVNKVVKQLRSLGLVDDES
jgi:DNA-binding MarR family transcriptional regulator